MENKIKYSRIIAGTMTWGSWGKAFSKKESIETIQHCLEHGITTFDHADIYGDYTNETDFGKAFVATGIPRDSVQLISKCGIQLTGASRKNTLKHYQYSKDYIVKSVEDTLKNLQTDYLDLFLLHRPSPLMHPNEIHEAVTILQEHGKIREFGVSNFTPSQIAMLESRVPVHANQIEFSLTADSPMYDGTMDDCIAHGRMVMAWSPLGGFFREESIRQQRIKKVMHDLEKKYNVTSSALLLAWVLKHPSIVHPVVGTTNKSRLADAARSEKIDLEREDWFALLAASQGHEVP